MKINIIVAKSGREKQFPVFLRYLNTISKEHDVKVYISYCDSYPIHSRAYQNIEIVCDHIDLEVFNKSKLLNNSLNIMRKDYDYVCVFDIDMIYNKEFFNNLGSCFDAEIDYVVSYGKKLCKMKSDSVYSSFFTIDEISNLQGDEFKGCSQISINKKVIDIFTELFGKVFNESYESWGGEDSDLSFKSRVLDKMGIIKKRVLYNCWTHLWHQSNKPINYVPNGKNYKLFHSSVTEIENRIKQYGRHNFCNK